MPRQNKGYRLRRKPGGIFEAVTFVQGRAERFTLQSADKAEAVRRLGIALRERAIAGAESDPIVMTLPQEFALTVAADICRCPDWASRVTMRADGDGEMEVTIPLSAVQAEEASGSSGLKCGALLDSYRAEHIDAGGVVDRERPGYAIANLKVHFGQTDLSALDIPLCRAYGVRRASGEIGRPSGGPTVRRELGVLSAAISHAWRWKRIGKHEIPFIELPEKSEPNDRYLDRSHEKGNELTRLFAAAKARGNGKRLSRCYRFVALAYYCGSRKTAIETLKWFQVNWKANDIDLNPPGRKQTKKFRPVVPIDDALLPILERAFAEKVSEYVLDHPGSIKTTFYATCKTAGIEDFSPHGLRHSRGTHLAQDGVDPYAISRLLGDTLETVDDVYLHGKAAEVAKAIKRRRK